METWASEIPSKAERLRFWALVVLITGMGIVAYYTDLVLKIRYDVPEMGWMDVFRLLVLAVLVLGLLVRMVRIFVKRIQTEVHPRWQALIWSWGGLVTFSGSIMTGVLIVSTFTRFAPVLWAFRINTFLLLLGNLMLGLYLLLTGFRK